MQKAFGTFGTGACADSSAAASFGVFQNIHINQFPVRAAIDIGTGGLMSMAVGRVDAAQNVVRNLMYHTQLPIQLLSASAASFSGSNSTLSSSFVLSETTRTDIRNKMRLLHGALRRERYEGLSEKAALISWPLCEAGDSLSLAEELTREFKVDVRVLGKTFHVDIPFVNSKSLTSFQKDMSLHDRQKENSFFAHKNDDGSDDNSLQLLTRQLLRRREKRRQSVHSTDSHSHSHSHVVNEDSRATPPEEQLKQLSFLAHAAASKCIAPQRMIVFTEDRERGLYVLGIDKKEGVEKDKVGVCRVGPVRVHAVEESSCVLSHALPVDISAAQRILLTVVQRRSDLCIDKDGLRSPNPVLWEEFLRLRQLLEEMISPTLPEWVRRRSEDGGFICGSSYNGGVLNLAARVAQQSNVTLDHLETHARMHYCGLTDVLLSVNYPDSTAVLPGAAVASALMRAVETNRFEYLPEVTIPTALLVQPSLWIYGRREKLRAALQSKSFFSGGSARRTFSRPHIRENPTAVPGASWQHNQPWNPLSYENSTRGT